MNAKPRRRLILTVAVACAGAAIVTAFAVATDTTPDPLTREELYREGMSLKEIAAAASGQPGGLAPPCPDVATATRLKEAGLAFGPCDLLPEEGAAVRIADPQNEPTPEDDGVVCPGVILGKGVDLTVTIPCGRGAEIIKAAAVEVRGRYCARVTYLAERDSPPRTETLCEGDVPSIGGAPVRGPATTGN